jgi:hypothetical protein
MNRHIGTPIFGIESDGLDEFFAELLLRFLLLAISNALAFFLALSGSFAMYVLTKLTWAHMQHTLSPML